MEVFHHVAGSGFSAQGMVNKNWTRTLHGFVEGALHYTWGISISAAGLVIEYTVYNTLYKPCLKNIVSTSRVT